MMVAPVLLLLLAFQTTAETSPSSAAARSVSQTGARIVSRSKLWRDEDPTDGVCATKAAGFDCVGKTCSSGPSDCYCSCGYHMYGGPQLAVTKAGTLLSIVEGRKHSVDGGDEGAGGHKAWHDILIKRSSDSGTSWSNASVVYSESGGWGQASGTANSTIGNAELAVDLETGEIFAFMCRNNSQVLLASSTDDAATFTVAKDVTEQVKPDSLRWGWYASSFSSVQLKFNKEHRGRLVSCADHVLHQFVAYPIENSHSHTIISDDHGKSWRVGGVQALNTSNECSVAELSNGTVVMNSRNYVGQSKNTVHRYISHSYDGGESFTVGWFAEDLPDPVVFSDLTSTADGKTLLLTHPNSETTRRNVTLFSSADGGASWQLSAQLESGPSEYSSVVVLPNGSVAVQVDAGCQGHKPSDYGNKACDKAAPQQEDFFIIDLKSDDEEGSAAAGITPTTEPNMNGEYLLAPTPKAPNPKFSTSFKDYPGGVESFTLYAGPITSTYSEVFWTALPEVNLPDDIVKRFKGKGMAVVGFEADQVRRGAGPNGEDVSVPINVAYNHHYSASLLGEGSHMERVPYDPKDPRTTLFSPEPGWSYVPVEHSPSPNGLPTSVWGGYSNGGEFRKTYHGLAPPYAQIIESPTKFAFTPMQIDTWNRDKMNLTGGPFVPGPYPQKAHQGHWPSGSAGKTKWPSGSLAPRNGTDAIYSGLLECPLTSRTRKHLTGGGWNDSFAANIACQQQAKVCPQKLGTAEACFEAANHVVIAGAARVTTEQGSSALLPSGCSVSVQNGTARVYFNTNAKSTACCGSGVDAITGSQESLVNLSLTVSAKQGVTITMSGPSDGKWFGVGFDTISMANAPYTIVVDGAGKVTERILADHAAGIVLNTSVKVVSNTVSDGKRTVVMTRPLKGLTARHHDFDVQQLSLSFISAVGSSSSFGFHKAKTVSAVALWPQAAKGATAAAHAPAACVCSVPAAPFGKGTGTIQYLGGPAKPDGDVIGFPFRCEQYPRETVLRDQNPTCDIRTYVGGLSTCHHGWHLLDADQEVPYQDQPLTYHFKFRWYFQEYKPTPKPSHINAYSIHCLLGIGGSVTEYDVPQCAPGTPTENCTHEISGVVTPPGKDMRFVGAHYHCHAPTCLRMEIYNNLTGELLCREDTYHGKGADVSGKGSPTAVGKDRFDEAGYIAQRICLWSSNSSFGLEPPPLVSGVPLLVKAITNSTYGHHGEMALPEMMVIGG